MCIITIGITQGSITALVSTLLLFLPKLLTRLNPFTDLWAENSLLHVITKDRLIAAKEYEEEQTSTRFVCLRRDPEDVADTLFPKWGRQAENDDSGVEPLLSVNKEDN